MAKRAQKKRVNGAKKAKNTLLKTATLFYFDLMFRRNGMQGHKDKNLLTSPYAKSVVKKESFDSARIQLFENLIVYIKKCSFRDRVYKYKKSTFKNISFFESYFSNSFAVLGFKLLNSLSPKPCLS